MKIIFIRHGEPNYRELEERSYTGFGIDLAPLSEKGRQQAQELCKNPLFGSADILVSSAVTRALETAFLCILCYWPSFEGRAIIA